MLLFETSKFFSHNFPIDLLCARTQKRKINSGRLLYSGDKEKIKLFLNKKQKYFCNNKNPQENSIFLGILLVLITL